MLQMPMELLSSFQELFLPILQNNCTSFGRCSRATDTPSSALTYWSQQEFQAAEHKRIKPLMVCLCFFQLSEMSSSKHRLQQYFLGLQYVFWRLMIEPADGCFI